VRYLCAIFRGHPSVKSSGGRSGQHCWRSFEVCRQSLGSLSRSVRHRRTRVLPREPGPHHRHRRSTTRPTGRTLKPIGVHPDPGLAALTFALDEPGVEERTHWVCDRRLGQSELLSGHPGGMCRKPLPGGTVTREVGRCSAASRARHGAPGRC